MNTVDKSGYVYVMVSGEELKIGRSRDPERRVNQLKTARPDIKLLYKLFVADMYIAEKSLHSIFAFGNITQEWFKLDINAKGLLSRIFKNTTTDSKEEAILKRMGLR